MGFTSKYLLPLFTESSYGLDYILGLSITLGFLSLLFFRIQNKRKEKKVNKTLERSKKLITDFQKSFEDDFDVSNLVPPSLPEDLKHVPYKFLRYSPEVSLKKSEEFYHLMNNRRTLRYFSSDDVDQSIIENLIRTSGTSPSGAHTQPWTFVAVRDPEIKEQIREIIEKEEEYNYLKRMGNQWTLDLKGLRTNWEKEYLTEAPWLILVFRQAYFPLEDGKRRNHYYNEISTAIATGLLLAAVQNAGLVALTSTPMNCGPALRNLLGRGQHEKLMTLLPVGYPRKDATVPDFGRKPLEEIMVVV